MEFDVEAAECGRLFSGLQFAVAKSVLPASARLQCQTTVSPELPLGPESMGCLDQADQQCDSDWAQPRNLAKKLMGGVVLTFEQQLGTRFSTDLSQGIQLLIELLSTATHARFRELFQPRMTAAGGIYLCAGAWNRPATVSAE
jgi:hypothetical protein